MLHVSKINNYLKILTDDEMEDFVVINAGEYFKSTKEKLYSKLCDKQSIRKVAESLYIFLTTSNEVEKYAKMMQSNAFDSCVHHYNIETFNLFGRELQLINTKPMNKRKLKELLIILIILTFFYLSSDNISLKIQAEKRS